MSKIIIGLSGYRCSGKSTIRQILIKNNIPVFDTNSVKTGDKDANHISVKEIISRYGKGESYINFIKSQLELFIKSQNSIVFIDSFKILNDKEVIQQLFPEWDVKIWFLHTNFKTRETRYKSRDVQTNFRTEPLLQHDKSLEELGFLDLFKNADYVLNMDDNLKNIEKLILELINKNCR